MGNVCGLQEDLLLRRSTGCVIVPDAFGAGVSVSGNWTPHPSKPGPPHVIGLNFFNPPVVEGESWRTRWAVSGILDESSGLKGTQSRS